MKIINIKKISGCLEGINVRDVLFDESVTKEFILFLGSFGKLIYQDSFEKPFYKVIMRTANGTYSIKGSEGNKSARLLLPDVSDTDILNDIQSKTAGFNIEH